MSIRIALTWSETRYSNYPIWVKGDNPDIELVEIASDQPEVLHTCHGLVLSGGIDMHPSYYGSSRTDYPLADPFNTDRDEFETQTFKKSQELKIPVLGICRGLQLINAVYGGTLIQSLDESGKADHKRQADHDTIHEIAVVESSLLYQITQTLSGSINSAHHQAIDKLGTGLMANSYSPDGVIEGVEWIDKKAKPWLMAVQWHPERMRDRAASPFSHHLYRAFITAIHHSTSNR
jgi:putative glutamine amidotransferase